MASLSQIPTSNVRTEDIRDTLNANGGSVSNDATTFFTTAAKINPWSKHKPVPILSKNFVQDFDSSRSDYDADWWKGDDGKCGLSWSVYTNTNDVKGKNWTYTPPSGSYPKRLGDFAGYYPGANPPIGTAISADIHEFTWIAGTSLAGQKFTIEMDIPTSSYEALAIQDFNVSLDDWYLCAIAGKYEYKGDNVLSSGCSVTIDIADLGVGTHSVCICLVSGAGGVYMPLPSDSSNKTNFSLRVKYLLPYSIEFTEIGDSLYSMEPISNYQGGNNYRRASSSIYYKAIVTRNHINATSVEATALTGYSPTWDGGSTTESMSGKMYDSSRVGRNSISLTDLSVGASKTIYFYWGGFGDFTSVESGEIFYADFALSNDDGAVVANADFIMQKT